MSTIRAVVVDAEAPARLTLGEVAPPVAGPGDAVVRVRAISLNRGEVRGAQNARPGSRPGWDIAGIVEEAAADGTGPRAGERVVGLLRTGAWAELVAVPSAALAVLPEGVSFAEAATLPVAGLTALYAIDLADGLVGRNVLVTGASGGVGHFGVQLAVQSGARVTGLVRQEKHVEVVQKAGAHAVFADETGLAAKANAPFDHVLESVGGQVLGNVLGMMAPYSRLVLYGVSGGGAATFDSAVLLRTRMTVMGLGVFAEAARLGAGVGLARLAAMITAGTLSPLIAIEASWTEIGGVAQQLLDRSYPGKAVLQVE